MKKKYNITLTVERGTTVLVKAKYRQVGSAGIRARNLAGKHPEKLSDKTVAVSADGTVLKFTGCKYEDLFFPQYDVLSRIQRGEFDSPDTDDNLHELLTYQLGLKSELPGLLSRNEFSHAIIEHARERVLSHGICGSLASDRQRGDVVGLYHEVKNISLFLRKLGVIK